MNRYWLAPEVIARQPYSTPVDIWGLGALCCAMVTKAPPNGHMNPIKVLPPSVYLFSLSFSSSFTSSSLYQAMYLTAVQGVSISEILSKNQCWSEGFRDFLTQCFRMDPAARPTATALLQVNYKKIKIDKIAVENLKKERDSYLFLASVSKGGKTSRFNASHQCMYDCWLHCIITYFNNFNS